MMGKYCIKCNDKLESLKVMGNFRRYESTGLFSGGGYQWDDHTLNYCDNKDCERYGVLVVVYNYERTKLAPPVNKEKP